MIKQTNQMIMETSLLALSGGGLLGSLLWGSLLGSLLGDFLWGGLLDGLGGLLWCGFLDGFGYNIKEGKLI